MIENMLPTAQQAGRFIRVKCSIELSGLLKMLSPEAMFLSSHDSPATLEKVMQMLTQKWVEPETAFLIAPG